MIDICDWTDDEVWGRMKAATLERCSQRNPFRTAVEMGQWDSAMERLGRSAPYLRQQLLREAFTVFPNGREVADFIANLPDIPYFRPMLERDRLIRHLQHLVALYQRRLEKFAGNTVSLLFPVDITFSLEAAQSAAQSKVPTGNTRVLRHIIEGAVRAAAKDKAKEATEYLVWWATAHGQLLTRSRELKKLGHRSPFGPLMEIVRLGCWPVGTTGKGEQRAFLVYVPPMSEGGEGQI